MKAKCLIIDEMHPSLIPMIEQLNIKADYRPNISRSEVEEIISGYEGLVIRSKILITESLLDKATKLKFIARAGAGLDQIDLDAIEKRGIHLFNAPEGNMDALAEHTIGLILAVLNNICFANKQVVEGIWNREQNRGFELKDKTVAIFGFGYMGKAVAERLFCLGCRVIGYDKNIDKVDERLAERVSLQQLFREADIVSFHIPLDFDTKGLVDKAFLNRFEKPVWLINTARGEILKLKDLLFALKEDKVKGAALDVIENEKPQTWSVEEKKIIHDLADTGKVIFTPHVGGWSHESYVRINYVLVEKLKKSGLFS